MRNIFATVLCIAAAAISTTSTPTRNDALGASGIVFSSTTNNSQSGFPMPSGPNGQSSNITTAGGGSVVIGSGVAFIPAVGPVNLSSSTTSTYMSLLYGPVNASNPVFSPPIQGPNNASSSNFFQTASCGGNGVTTNVTYQFSSVASLTGPANSTTSLSYSWTGTGNSGPFSGSATFLYSYGNSSTALPYWVDQTPIVAGSSAGMVLSGTTKVYVIYYGALTYGTTYWTNSAKTTLINNFISQLSNSAWFSTAKQYGVGNMVLGKTITVDCFNTGRDGNRYVSPGSCTMRPDPTTKQNFVSQIIWRNIYLASDDINGLSPDFLGIKEVMDPTFNHFLLPKDPNGIYLVLGGPETYEQWAYPSGATIGQSYCGYHGQFSADAVGDNVYQYLSSNVSTSPFYNLPYPRKDGYVYNYIYAMVPVSYSAAVAQPGGMTPNLPSKCVTPFNANNSPNGFPEIDSLLGVIAHELVETLVSPAPFQTFSDTEGNEVMDKCLGLYLDLINQGSYSFNAVVGNIVAVLPHIWAKSGGCMTLVPIVSPTSATTSPATTSLLIDNFATQNINVAYKQTSALVGGGTSSWSAGALSINPTTGSYFTTLTATCANTGSRALSYIQVVASVPAGDTFNVVVYATNSACNGLAPTPAQIVAGTNYLVSTSSSGVSTFLIPITASLFPNGIWAINLQQWSSSATVTLYSISFTGGASTTTTTTTSAAASTATSIVIDNFLTVNVNSAYHQTSALVGGGTSSWSSGSLLFSPAITGYFTTTTATCANTNAALPFVQFTAAIPVGESFNMVAYATNSACNGLASTASQNTILVSSSSALTTYRVPLTASLFPNGIWAINLQSWSSTAQIQITSISFSS